MPFASSMSKVCLGIMLTIAPVFKALFLVDNTNARRLPNDAIELRRLAI